MPLRDRRRRRSIVLIGAILFSKRGGATLAVGRPTSEPATVAVAVGN